MTTQENEQQVDGGHGGQTGAFNEQAAPGHGEQPVLREPTWSGAPVQQNEQQVHGGWHGGQTGAFNEQAAPVHSEHPVLSEQPTWSGTHGEDEHSYGTAVHEEPVHISSEEPSHEDAGHAEDSGGYAGHDGGADADQAVHHG
ncbi:MAG TPA: hypothetical protein VH589_16370 [Trebonia sp.]